MTDPRSDESEPAEVTPADAALLAELGAALRTGDAVPHEVVAASKAAIHLPRLDGEIAQLLDEASLAGSSRGAPTAEVLTFESPSLVIDVEVYGVDGRRVVGRLIPEQQAAVTLESGRGDRSTRSGADGEFALDDLPTGPARLHAVTDAGVAVTTAWFTL